LEQQDLILGFERKFHVDKLKRKFKNLPELTKKLSLLLEFTEEKGNLDIFDPFGLEEEEYNKILHKIEIAVEKAIEKIIKINE
jgi:protein-tyrosine-phosphatase